MTLVYFRREKLAVPKIVKKFKQLVENQSGHHMKTSLRSDHRKEYTLKGFKNFCKECVGR